MMHNSIAFRIIEIFCAMVTMEYRPKVILLDFADYLTKACVPPKEFFTDQKIGRLFQTKKSAEKIGDRISDRISDRIGHYSVKTE